MPVLLVAYVIVGTATTWLGYWWFVAFVVLSAVISAISAVRNYEYWPVAHPAYGFFFTAPAMLIAYGFIFSHPLEWGQWFAWSAALAVVITGVLTLLLRHHIDREWAVVSTLAVAIAFSGFALEAINVRLGHQSSRFYFASIAYTSPGGYRQGGPRITVETENGRTRTFFVGWDSYFRQQDGRALCVHEFEGGLGWRWSTLSDCPDGVP